MITEKQYCADPDYVLREIAGESILIPTGSAAYAFNGLAALNETGRFLWQMLSRPCTAAELAGALAREYDLTEAQSEGDVHDFLELAISRGLVSTPADQASGQP